MAAIGDDVSVIAIYAGGIAEDLETDSAASAGADVAIAAALHIGARAAGGCAVSLPTPAPVASSTEPLPSSSLC